MRSTWTTAVLLFLSLAAAPPMVAQSGDTADQHADRRAERDRAREARARERATERDEDDDVDDGDHFSSSQGRPSIDTTVAFSRGGVVDLSLVSGDIRVVGWSRGDVRVQARAEEGGDIRFEASASRVSLELARTGRHGGEAHYQLSVPEGTRVLMRSTSADLSARGVKGEVEARTVSGDVVVEDAVRRVTIETVSGDVKAARLGGDVSAHSVSGDVTIQQLDGDLDAEAVSGSLSVSGARSKVTRFETVSGDVTYAGTIDPAGRYDFHSHSGTVRLVLPAGTSAALSVESFSGEIDSQFPLTLSPQATSGRGRRPRRMEFTLGKGGPRINAETFSGDVVIERSSR